MNPLSFTDELLARQPTSGIDVVTTLSHFAIVTYRVAPDVLRQHIHPRFEPDLIDCGVGEAALVSVVPFVDQDFRLARFPWLKGHFGQTNYRAYVTDTETGEHAVWFFGTSLDSPTVFVPRQLWKLPWHKASIRFDCEYDALLAVTGRIAWGRTTVGRMPPWSLRIPARHHQHSTGSPILRPAWCY